MSVDQSLLTFRLLLELLSRPSCAGSRIAGAGSAPDRRPGHASPARSIAESEVSSIDQVFGDRRRVGLKALEVLARSGSGGAGAGRGGDRGGGGAADGLEQLRSLLEVRAWSREGDREEEPPASSKGHNNVKINHFVEPASLPLRSVFWKAFLLFKRGPFGAGEGERRGEAAIEEIRPDSDWVVIQDAARKNYMSLKSRMANLETAEEESVLSLIRSDVKRCNTDIPGVAEPETQALITEMLQTYCRLHPELGYWQGMHELLAIVLYVVRLDAVDNIEADPGCPADEAVLRKLLDSKFVEHDAFTLFDILMSNAYHFFSSDVTSIFDFDRGNKRQVGGSPSVIERRIEDIITRKLSLVDEELWRHLQPVKDSTTLVLIRWMCMIFSHEFTVVPGVLDMWDSIFAEDPSLMIVDYVCVAIIAYYRTSLIEVSPDRCYSLLRNVQDLREKADRSTAFRLSTFVYMAKPIMDRGSLLSPAEDAGKSDGWISTQSYRLPELGTAVDRAFSVVSGAVDGVRKGIQQRAAPDETDSERSPQGADLVSQFSRLWSGPSSTITGATASVAAAASAAATSAAATVSSLRPSTQNLASARSASRYSYMSDDQLEGPDEFSFGDLRTPDPTGSSAAEQDQQQRRNSIEQHRLKPQPGPPGAVAARSGGAKEESEQQQGSLRHRASNLLDSINQWRQQAIAGPTAPSTSEPSKKQQQQQEVPAPAPEDGSPVDDSTVLGKMNSTLRSASSFASGFSSWLGAAAAGSRPTEPVPPVPQLRGRPLGPGSTSPIPLQSFSSPERTRARKAALPPIPKVRPRQSRESLPPLPAGESGGGGALVPRTANREGSADTAVVVKGGVDGAENPGEGVVG